VLLAPRLLPPSFLFLLLLLPSRLALLPALYPHLVPTSFPPIYFIRSLPIFLFGSVLLLAFPSTIPALNRLPLLAPAAISSFRIAPSPGYPSLLNLALSLSPSILIPIYFMWLLQSSNLFLSLPLLFATLLSPIPSSFRMPFPNYSAIFLSSELLLSSTFAAWIPL
jgi:hypothetical protein